MNVTLEELKPVKATPAPRKNAPAKQQSDAKRFDGQPVIQWNRLCRAMEEVLFYRASGRHRDERETSEMRSHERWKKEATALARAVADALVEGQYEPLKPVQPAPVVEEEVEY